MRGYLFLVLFAGIMQAITLPANIDKAKMDNAKQMISGPHYPFVPQTHIIPVDSSCDEYCMWTQMDECLAYNPTVGNLEFVCDNFVIGSHFDVSQTDSNFSLLITDEDVYSAELGPGAYSTAIAGTNPYISFSYLISGQWGGMGADYESGGWFSSSWDVPRDLGPGDVDAFKNIGKQLANGNILFIALTTTYQIIYRTYNPALDSMIAGGVLAPPTHYYWGFDYNGGVGYVFYYDNSLNIYYRTTTDGINWSSEQVYNMVWPEPYASNIMGWTQAVVTDGGNPILIFDNWNGDDYNANIYPFRSKVYVSTASGANCIEVGNTTTDSKNFYPTIASEGNYVVTLFGQPRSGTGQYTFWDIYYNYSTDNGVTWSTPRNLTGSITEHNNCLWQIAKRVDAIGDGQLFFAFGSSISDPLLDLYWNIINGGNPTSCRWYVGRNPVVGIAENKTERPSRLSLSITPNPVCNQASISYTLPKSGNVFLNLYSADGRLIKKIEQGYKEDGIYTVSSDTHNLANGIYIIVLRVDNRILSGKLVVAH